MFEFGSFSSTQTSLFDSGLSSILTNSTNNSITSGSPPTPFANRPDALFSSLYGTDNGSSPTDALSSLLEPFAGANELDRKNEMERIARPNSFNSSSLFSIGNDFGNLNSTNSSIDQMTLVANLTSPQQQPMSENQTSGGGGNSPPPKNPKLYKTELCRSWMDHGRCNYGERCQYAHGELEKRPVPRHPKYKTEACQSFHQTGYCPYGPRCHFIHNETPNGSAATTPITVNGQPSLYASQYHNMTMRQQQNQQQQQKQSATSVPSNVLQRVYSLPGGYGSAGESPAGSSNDSGSESPNGSFSPGLDLDETGPFSSNYNHQKASVPRHETSRYLSCDLQSSNFNDNQFSNLLNEICQWNIEDALSNSFTNSITSQYLNSTTDDMTMASSNQKSGGVSTPGRLPVFAQLSNPQ